MLPEPNSAGVGTSFHPAVFVFARFIIVASIVDSAKRRQIGKFRPPALTPGGYMVHIASFCWSVAVGMCTHWVFHDRVEALSPTGVAAGITPSFIDGGCGRLHPPGGDWLRDAVVVKCVGDHIPVGGKFLVEDVGKLDDTACRRCHLAVRLDVSAAVERIEKHRLPRDVICGFRASEYLLKCLR